MTFTLVSTCIGSGAIIGGCCEETGGPCSSVNKDCYCDSLCFDQGDCCVDIGELGCSGKYVLTFFVEVKTDNHTIL